MTNSKRLGWGLIGASDIAKTRMIEAIKGQPDSAVVAVMSTSEERAKRYAAENGIPRFYSSVEAVLADCENLEENILHSSFVRLKDRHNTVDKSKQNFLGKSRNKRIADNI